MYKPIFMLITETLSSPWLFTRLNGSGSDFKKVKRKKSLILSIIVMRRDVMFANKSGN